MRYLWRLMESNWIANLKFKTADKILLLHVPEALQASFQGFKIISTVETACTQQALVFITSQWELKTIILPLLSCLCHEAVFWIAYPKKSGRIASDLTRDKHWQLLNEADWLPVSNVAVDRDWTVLRFRHKGQIKSLKRSVAMEDRLTPGVDYIARTVELPEDAALALELHEGMLTFFQRLSFSHKREYAEAIASAKKPETRQRRIAQMILMLQNLKENKT
ncbi:MAG: YdeI/OmpD-associated family protein [Bacteroidetes bacterium]|nr:YdeI/OmpD-associated family protein [Bacteroidota bacterium]MBS1741134.1 YdeI/OmpD-associated family protein [Bacteroidota bacterium]